MKFYATLMLDQMIKEQPDPRVKKILKAAKAWREVRRGSIAMGQLTEGEPDLIYALDSVESQTK